MKICKNCGASLTDDAVFCNSCGARVAEEPVTRTEVPTPPPVQPVYNTSSVNLQDVAKAAGNTMGKLAGSAATGISNAAQGAKQAYTAATSTSCRVKMAEGEVKVRDYAVTKVGSIFMRKSGRLLITNKRVIFYAGSYNDGIVSTEPIDKIGDIVFVNGTDINFFRLIIGAILLIFSFVAGDMYRSKTIPLVILLLGIVFIALAFKKAFYMGIYSEGMSPGGIFIGRPQAFTTVLYAIEGVSDVDADRAMNEIGAVILDLQQMGDHAIEKWQNL